MKVINTRGFLNGMLAGAAVGMALAGLLAPRASMELPDRLVSGSRVVGAQTGRAARSIGTGVRRMLRK